MSGVSVMSSISRVSGVFPLSFVDFAGLSAFQGAPPAQVLEFAKSMKGAYHAYLRACSAGVSSSFGDDAASRSSSPSMPRSCNVSRSSSRASAAVSWRRESVGASTPASSNFGSASALSLCEPSRPPSRFDDGVRGGLLVIKPECRAYALKVLGSRVSFSALMLWPVEQIDCDSALRVTRIKNSGFQFAAYGVPLMECLASIARVVERPGEWFPEGSLGASLRRVRVKPELLAKAPLPWEELCSHASQPEPGASGFCSRSLGLDTGPWPTLQRLEQLGVDLRGVRVVRTAGAAPGFLHLDSGGEFASSFPPGYVLGGPGFAPSGAGRSSVSRGLVLRTADTAPCGCGVVIDPVPRMATATNQQEPGVFRWNRDLSRYSNASGVNVLVRVEESCVFTGACRELEMGGEDGEAVAKVHKGVTGGVVDVSGSFVQAYFPVGVSVSSLDGLQLSRGGTPCVVSAYRRLALRVWGDPGWVYVRNRAWQSRQRWLEQSLAVDPKSSFSRFWSYVGAETALFSVPAAAPASEASVSFQGTTQQGVSFSVGKGYGAVDVYGGACLKFPYAPVRLNGLLVPRGGEVVLGERVGRVVLSSADGESEGVNWELYAVGDEYAIDNGGPSDDEGFLSEF